MAERENDIFGKMIVSSIWSTPPPSEQPKIKLIRWSVQESQTGDRYFVGYNPDDHEGRVSTPIQSFDPAASEGVTKSGRIYHLVGPAGHDPDGYWVWAHIASARGIKAKDVTSEFMALIAAEATD